MGGEPSSCYKEMDKQDKDKELSNMMTNYPKDSPKNQHSNSMTPMLTIKKKEPNLNFDPKENAQNQEEDPLSSKDPLDSRKIAFVSKNKKTVIYKGYFMDNKYEGEGIFQFKNGDWFKGRFFVEKKIV